MKKSLIALLSVMVVLVFTASAFALHEVKSAEYTPSLVKASKAQIELNGQIRIRGNLQKNFDLNDKTEDTSQKYDQRVRLGLKATTSPNTFGVVELETGTTGGTYDWGTYNAKSQQLSIRQAYIAHQTKALGTMSGFKAGKLLLALGNRLFFDNSNYGDDAIVLWINAGPAEISLIDIKVSENTTTADSRSHDKKNPVAKTSTSFNMNDYDAYVLAVAVPAGKVNISADVTDLRNRSTATYTKGVKLYNYGARVDADMDVVKVKADVEYQHGSSYRNRSNNALALGEYKYSGYAGLLGLEVKAGSVATIRAGGAYGSGDKSVKAPKKDRRNEGFQTLLTDNQYSTFIYDYSLKGASGTGVTGQGLNNTYYVTAGATVKPMADFKVSADYYFLRADEPVALNGAKKDNGNDLKSKDLGHEVDAKIEYQIDTNLAYYIEAGYLFAGNAYDRRIDYRAKNVDVDNPYRIRHGIILEF